MFFLSLNIVMWSLGSWMMTRDRRYMSAKKAFLNPSSIAVYIGLIICFGHIPIPERIEDMIVLVGRMATPMCMVILGMRLALVPIKPMFTSPIQYLAIALKLVVFPLLALLILKLLPLEENYIRGVYILCCVPVGNLVLSFAEMLGEGQKTAAGIVLLGTTCAAITMPLITMLL
jgi:predicted permease